MNNKENNQNYKEPAKVMKKNDNQDITKLMNLLFDEQINVETTEKINPVDEIKPVDEIQKKWDMNDKILNLFGKNIVQDQKLRRNYAIILILMLGIELLTLIVLFILGGCGVLHYSETTFNIFISGGIAEVFVLVRVIVKYLFKDNLTDALKIILTQNNNEIKAEKSNKLKRTDKP